MICRAFELRRKRSRNTLRGLEPPARASFATLRNMREGLQCVLRRTMMLFWCRSCRWRRNRSCSGFPVGLVLGSSPGARRRQCTCIAVRRGLKAVNLRISYWSCARARRGASMCRYLCIEVKLDLMWRVCGLRALGPLGNDSALARQEVATVIVDVCWKQMLK